MATALALLAPVAMAGDFDVRWYPQRGCGGSPGPVRELSKGVCVALSSTSYSLKIQDHRPGLKSKCTLCCPLSPYAELVEQSAATRTETAREALLWLSAATNATSCLKCGRFGLRATELPACYLRALQLEQRGMEGNFKSVIRSGLERVQRECCSCFDNWYKSSEPIA
jgi:hypothetical protein